MNKLQSQENSQTPPLVGRAFYSRISAFFSIIGFEDLFVFGGMAMIGYGLWLFKPWVGYAVSGAIMMLFGLGWLFRRPSK